MVETATTAIAKKVRALRRERRWTAERVANEMTLLGVKWNRGVVAALETGQRRSVSVGELLALGRVFDVPPLSLAEEGEAALEVRPPLLEVVDLARVTAKPGDTLLVRPRDHTGFFGHDQVGEIRAWLEHEFPDLLIKMLPIAADVAVIEGGADG